VDPIHLAAVPTDHPYWRGLMLPHPGNKEVGPMTQAPVAIGASASCTDGACGQVIRVVVNPVGLTVTHLVVGPKHAHGHHIHRLVPVDLTEITTDGIRLSCTKAEFDELKPAEETHFEEIWNHPEYEPDQVWRRRRTVTYDSVPIGEVQVRRGEHVHATDGNIGQVEGLVIDPDNHQVTHVLLQEGHVWGRKEVAIPIEAVTRVEAGIRLNLSKRQVEDLPPVAIEHNPLVVIYGHRRTRRAET
jgi:sporulation protein YlmC with PRC-barrel domain